jgi:hypothetical protein
MSKLSAGDVCWARDPTDAHPQRPVIVLAHDTHPFSATDCTVMCIGTNAGRYQQTTPKIITCQESYGTLSLPDEHSEENINLRTITVCSYPH